MIPDNDDSEDDLYLCDVIQRTSLPKLTVSHQNFRSHIRSKPSKSYSRLRLHTFPQMSFRRTRPRVCRHEIRRKWLEFRNTNPALGTQNIDMTPSNDIQTVNPIMEDNDNFGHLELTWDHSSDLNSGEYKDFELELSKIACEVVNTVLQEEDDDDQIVNTENAGSVLELAALDKPSNRLELSNGMITEGRVYDVGNQLQYAQSLLVEHEGQPSNALGIISSKETVFVKRKRLSSSASHTSTKGLEEKSSRKKKRRSKTEWFIKKMTFSKKK